MSKPGAYKKTLKTDLTASNPVALDDASDDLSLGVSGVLPTANGGTGNANGTVAKLTNARTISLTGAVTGSGSFDGSGDVSIATTGDMSGAYVDLTSAQSVGGRKTFTDEPYVSRPSGSSSLFYSVATGGDDGDIRIGFGVASGGVNRGIYDNYLGKWLIYFNSAGNPVLNGAATVGGTTTPAYLASGVPTACTGGTVLPGTIAMYGGSSTPSGWLICNGSNVSRTTYANLYSAIGTSWGSGDGSSTFALPDFRNNFPMGVGSNSLAVAKSAGLPQISGGSVHQTYMSGQADGSSGAWVVEYQDDLGKRGSIEITDSGSYGMYYMRLYASYSNSIYNNSSTVQPPAQCVYFIIKT